ncbi:UbiA family prenyltransferase [Frankia tisae]|uniref:UbiA family prenyltransferase n=1 Tax=Frankia tisae TaxID=2950104 RepID=UPI0021BEA5A8|nr:UbiA family prenyltransferase [Frankia tisae]
MDLRALTRPEAALADAVPFAVGGLALTDPQVKAVLLLSLAGVLLSVYGRLLDAVVGVDVDRINPARQRSPLVQGRVAPGWVAGWAVLTGLAVAAGGWLWAASLPARIGFVALVGLRAWLTLSRRRTWRGTRRGTRGGPPLPSLLVAATVAGGLPLGVAAAGGKAGVGVLVLTAGFGLAALVTDWTVDDLRNLPTDRVCGGRTPALATGVYLRRPRGFVFSRRYAAIVLTAQIGLVVAVSATGGLALAAGPAGAALAPAGPGGPVAVAPVTPGTAGGHASLAGRGLAAAAAVLAALVATAGLVRLIRSGAPGLDPIRSPRPHGGGFVLANLLACQLASVAWLLTEPAGLPLWALLPAVGGWVVGLPLRLQAGRAGSG